MIAGLHPVKPLEESEGIAAAVVSPCSKEATCAAEHAMLSGGGYTGQYIDFGGDYDREYSARHRRFKARKASS